MRSLLIIITAFLLTINSTSAIAAGAPTADQVAATIVAAKVLDASRKVRVNVGKDELLISTLCDTKARDVDLKVSAIFMLKAVMEKYSATLHIERLKAIFYDERNPARIRIVVVKPSHLDLLKGGAPASAIVGTIEVTAGRANEKQPGVAKSGSTKGGSAVHSPATRPANSTLFRKHGLVLYYPAHFTLSAIPWPDPANEFIGFIENEPGLGHNGIYMKFYKDHSDVHSAAEGVMEWEREHGWRVTTNPRPCTVGRAQYEGFFVDEREADNLYNATVYFQDSGRVYSISATCTDEFKPQLMPIFRAVLDTVQIEH